MGVLNDLPALGLGYSGVKSVVGREITAFQAENRASLALPKTMSTLDGETISNPMVALPARTRNTTKGVSIEYVPQGNLFYANRDFDAFRPMNIERTSDGRVLMGKLANGNTIKLRPSNDGGRHRWTIEISKPNGRVIREIRYGNQ